MIVYMVVGEGYIHSYGSTRYCLGIFNTKEDAEAAAENYYSMVREEIFNLYQQMKSEHELEYYDEDYCPMFMDFDEFLKEDIDGIGYPRYYYYHKEVVVKIHEIELNKYYRMSKEDSAYRIEFENPNELSYYIE